MNIGKSPLNLEKITTEQRNELSAHIDESSTLEIVKLINDEDKKVALSVEKILPDIAKAADIIVSHLKIGGRLIYCGAGTSGRLGVLDAAECMPTFGVSPDLVRGIIAGGREAMFVAQEGAEDDPTLGENDMRAVTLTESDIVCGIAASGRTPYVLGALRYAKSIGCTVVAVTCAEHSPIEQIADIPLVAVTGAEVLTGSTRMKAGTATKMILNMLSTASMIRLGKAYGNLMVDLIATNEKLKKRAIRIVSLATGCDEKDSIAALKKSNGNVKVAILSKLTGKDKKEAMALLEKSDGHLKRAINLGNL